MTPAVIGAAVSVVLKALAPVMDPVLAPLLEAWAASKGLGTNVKDLKAELLCVQAVLERVPRPSPSLSSKIHNSALDVLLQNLQDLAYDADDVLDELEYFRIQDELDGSFDTAEEHPKGCGHNILLNAQHTVKSVGKLLCMPTCSSATTPGSRKKARDTSSSAPGTDLADREVSGCMPKLTSRACTTIHAAGKCLPCSSLPSVRRVDDDDDSVHNSPKRCETPKLIFDRVDASNRMKYIVEQLRQVRQQVSSIVGPLGSNSTFVQDNSQSRPVTTSYIIEPKLYGRDLLMNSVTSDITQDKYSANKLTVLPIVGPGGIGKTTFIQHVYQQVGSHFDVKIWICVSLSFNANRLAQEVVKRISEVNGQKENYSEQIEKILKNKRFLLVLDDVWTCHEDEWKRLLAPFKKGEEKGNLVIVTTRLPHMAKMVKTVDRAIQLDRLGTEDFMHFFEECVFGHQQHKWEDQELLDIGKKIVNKLKGSPLAAKTVGRLLRDLHTSEHWTRVLESKEWELTTDDNDIMPALKISYNYLPFHLQQCFSYCALFPEDYEFDSNGLIHLWMGLGILHPCDQRRRIEDVGQNYLNDLVNHGFFKKNERDNGCPYYVVHDLLHDLAVNISSYECASIYSSNVSSIQIPSSVRHLSIVVDEKDVQDRTSFGYYKRELSSLSKRLKVENLRTLMLFGEYHGSFAKTFGDLFEEATTLRTIYLSGASYIEDVLHNFSKLLHLRYLRIKSDYRKDIFLLSALSRLYHLEVIDVQECYGLSGSARDISNHVKLRHFLVPRGMVHLHSEIVDVGKLKLLTELKRFEIRKESKGFELSQLGQLPKLGGSLDICNLERVKTTEEAAESAMIHKHNLHMLTLEWDTKRPNKDPRHEENVLETMKPPGNIRDICIRGHGGTNCPKWLGENLSVKYMESLHLKDVSWENFPPLGELWLINEHGEEHLGCVPQNSFRNLRRLEFNDLPRCKKWVVSDPCHSFPHLEELSITGCFELTELSFSHSTCCPQQKEAKMNWFRRLQWLSIEDCPKLLSFPPIPWTKSNQCSAQIKGVGSGIEAILLTNSLQIEGKGDLDSTFWNMLAFDNLNELRWLDMRRCPPLPLHHFQMLSSLKTLELCHSSTASAFEGERSAEYQFPTEHIYISQWDASAKELTRLLSYFPKLSVLHVGLEEENTEFTGLGVVEKQASEAPAPAFSDNKVEDDAQIEQHQQQDGTKAEEEIGTSSAGGLLLLPPQLRNLRIRGCPELSLCSNPIDYNREAGLQGLRSLRSLRISGSPRFLSSYSPSSSSSCFPFPSSLEDLHLADVEGLLTLLPLSNLTSLINLSIVGSRDLRGEGIWPLLDQSHLTILEIHRSPNFFVGSKPLLHPSSSKLEKLATADIAGILTKPICTLLSSSLTELAFSEDTEMDGFTKGQNEALQLLTSLEKIRFYNCDKLQGLPAGLHGLHNLKMLEIYNCAAIWSLAKDGLPGSLQELSINRCPDIQSLSKDCLPSSLQKLEILACPAIQSLPSVNDLPSLRELDVAHSGNEELRRQCRKLIGTIPIVRA